MNSVLLILALIFVHLKGRRNNVLSVFINLLLYFIGHAKEDFKILPKYNIHGYYKKCY